jgi:O-antigen ligase
MIQPATASWRKWVLLFSMILMLAGVLFSRLVLSSALILFVIFSIVHSDFRSQLKEFFSSPVLWSMTVLFFIPLLSGLWSDDFQKWADMMRIKLPLLLFPVCFAGLKNFSSKDWEKLAWAFLLFLLIGCGWSLVNYLQDMQSAHAGYLRSTTIKTPVKNDHVRFSLLVSIAIFTAAFLFLANKRSTKTTRIFLVIVIIAFAVYLHVLAVRTGLICFYLSLLVFAGWLIWNRRHALRSFFLLVVLIGLPISAYFLFPTFKNRIRYFNYDISFARKNIYLPGSNDGTRILSIKAGWNIMNAKPLIGVGFGDVEQQTNQWYSQHYPQMIESDKILPSSEWIMYGAATGWTGIILFTIFILFPFFVGPVRKNVFWWLVCGSIVLSYLFDNGLEGQFSVFVHGFIILWWYKWLSDKNQNAALENAQ